MSISSNLLLLCVHILLADADFDSPLQLASHGASSTQQFVPDEGSLSMIESMGFGRRQATAALKATVRTQFHILSLYDCFIQSLVTNTSVSFTA